MLMDENLSGNKENEIKLQALIDNTAQGIFNYLTEIENKREVYEKRWIWELLQNALDSALQERKIEIKIIKNNNKLTFTHNGRLFKPEEVAHLIYHGSTKREDDIGKFGTGFLVTHLLSKKINVKGVREDNKKFDFELDREASSADDIKRLMEETWRKYQTCLAPVNETPSYTAEYEYSLNDISKNTAKEGIEALTKIAPYVLAFNDKLGTVELNDETGAKTFELVNETANSNYTTKIVKETIQGKEGEKSEELHELWIATNNEIEIAVKAKKKDTENYQIEDLHGIPKIFTAFPLFGTEDIPFPMVVNSRKFEPTEKRDGIFIGKEDTDDIKRNKDLLKEASDLSINLIKSLLETKKLDNVHTLLDLGHPPEKDWLDKNWYVELLKKLIDGIFKLKVLKTQSEDFKTLTEGFIPLVDGIEGEKIGKLWDLCYCFLDYKDRVPAKELAIKWANIIQKWETIGLNLIERKITIEKIALKIEACKNLQDFKTKLKDSTDEFTTLNGFYKILLDTGKGGLLDNRCLLPNQNGYLKKKPELYKDEGIDEVLKDISAKLNEDIRNCLLHSAISEDIKNLLSVKKEEEILNHVINRIKQPRLGDAQYLQANIDLFNWLLEHNKFEYFEGYPVLSLKENIFTLLSKQSKEKLLAPSGVWNEKARIYAELFPQDFIISSVYFKKISQKDKWDKLGDFILIDPLYTEPEKINQDYLEALLSSAEKLDEEKEHEVADDVEVSKISFLETKDKGIIDTVRKSKEKARKFLDLLFKYIIEEDNRWDTSLEVTCNCGTKHKIYQSIWLALLKNRAWIPIRKDKSEKPTAQHLALLLEDNKNLLQTCRQDKPSKLLRKLNVSIGELMMNVVAKNESIKLELDNAMGSLYSTFMTNPTQLTKIAELAESEPDLFVKEIEEKIQTREQIRRNQSVGSLVEILLKNVLEKEGFKVERTGRGSDFAVEHDFVEDNEEQILKIEKEEKICFYLEVKGTNQEYVKMTFPQAKEARDNSNKYVLCVVKYDGLEITEENVKNNARFIIDIGQMIRDKVSKAETFKHEQETVVESGDIEIEISEGPIRFKIYKRIWEKGKAFEQFLESIQGTEK